jgi:hypothetical protein
MLDPYLGEVRSPALPLAIGSCGLEVTRVQEWLTFHGFATGIDSEFGPATQAAVIAFQRSAGLMLPSTEGLVDGPTWSALIAPLVGADVISSQPDSFGDRVCRIARAHLYAKARELGGDNRGPFVRHYGRGTDQSVVGFVPWCQVFATHPWLKAAREVGCVLPFNLVTSDGNQSAYVPWVVNEARKVGRFVNGATATARIPPGSMFFVPGLIDGQSSHIHVGLVVADDGTTIQTIEGNTNHEGGSNGYEVAGRFRLKARCNYGLCT